MAEFNELIKTKNYQPPPEILSILEQNNFPQNKLVWYPVPSLELPTHRLSMTELMQNGQIDAVEIMRLFLGNPVYDRSLRIMDVLNGCGHQCDTCLADAALPTKIFSESSLITLFSNKDFLKILQPDSLRFGSTGDIVDHPAAINIVTMVLEQTRQLDNLRMNSEGIHYKVKVSTNYRSYAEKAIDQLIELVIQNPERLELTISLPFNRKDVVNDKFGSYVKAHPEIFGEYRVGDDGVPKKISTTKIQNLNVADVRRAKYLFMNGRVLDNIALTGRAKSSSFIERDRYPEFKTRGFSKVYLNPDGFWLHVYSTPYESHTGRLYTLVNFQNESVLTKIPYHPDFPTPPHWPGGCGTEKDNFTTLQLQRQARATRQMLPVNIIK